MQRKVIIWSLVIVLALLLYVTATLIFALLFREASDVSLFATRTPQPTFTVESAPATVVVEIPTSTPTPTSIPTETPLPAPTETPTTAPTAMNTPVPPQVVSDAIVNVRNGPSTNYPVVGALAPGTPTEVIGRNDDGTWWQVAYSESDTGWVAGFVVDATNTDSVPIAQAPPPPPTNTPAPVVEQPTPEPEQPSYQYSPSGWYGDVNYGLTRFLGTITDANGNPVNGVHVEAQCGDFRIISNPSGPIGWGPFNESHTWADGFYDITLGNQPIACKWFLSIVETPDKETVTARLSEPVEVETTYEESIITANWIKNY